MQQLVFQLAPGTTLIHSIYPIQQIWQINQSDIDEPPELVLEDGSHRLLVWRRHLEMRIDLLNPVQWQFLTAVNTGQTLLQTIETCPGINLQQVLPEAMANGWLTGFYLQTDRDISHEYR